MEASSKLTSHCHSLLCSFCRNKTVRRTAVALAITADVTISDSMTNDDITILCRAAVLADQDWKPETHICSYMNHKSEFLWSTSVNLLLVVETLKEKVKCKIG